MPAKSGAQARFDHVDDNGDLVFHSGVSVFHVQVNEQLELAILEAKQVRQENAETAPTHESQTLPISSIQALIRAGEEPDKVAEQYGLSAALVRRFTSSVQTEKQDAIEQFLAVNAPKGSHMHTVGDLINLTLTAAKINPRSVRWNATRQGRKPWRVCAQFKTPHNRVNAVWTWSMQDNGVECLNAAAKALLGETVEAPRTIAAKQQTTGDASGRATARQHNVYDPLPPYQQSNQSGESPRQKPAALPAQTAPSQAAQMGRLESAEAMDSSEPGNPQQPDSYVPSQRFEQASAQAETAYAPIQQDAADAVDNAAQRRYAVGASSNGTVPGNSTQPNGAQGDFWPPESINDNTVIRTPKSQSSAELTNQEPTTASQDPDSAQTQVFSPLQQNGQHDRNGQHGLKPGSTRNGKAQPNGKRKSGRSAMPSWDEIIFGD